MIEKSLEELKRELLEMANDAVAEITGNKGKPRFRAATPQKSKKLRGVGYTRKNKSESKKRRKIADESRRINRRK